MTATYQQGYFENYRNVIPKRYNYSHLYCIECEDFDHDCEVFEIEADNPSQAAEKAQDLFDRDVYNMNIYLLD